MAQSGAANLIIILWRYVLPFHHKTSKLLEINSGGETPAPPPASTVPRDIHSAVEGEGVCGQAPVLSPESFITA